MSQLSEVTDDVFAESVAEEDNDLKDYNRLVQQTQKKLKILGKSSLSCLNAVISVMDGSLYESIVDF